MTILIRNQELKELTEEFKSQDYLSDHTDDIDKALSYFMQDYESDELDVDTFIEHFTENYIDDAEIIYNGKAIKFLSEEDCRLQESLGIAQDYGYNLNNINSELLATLLLQDRLREELNNLKTNIEEYFESVQEELNQ